MSPTVQRWAGPVIEAEADRLRGFDCGTLEREDLIAEAWLALTLARSGVGLGALRLRLRGAMRDALRREWRALGRTGRTIRWPVWWPREIGRARYTYAKPKAYRRSCVDCGTLLERPEAQRCPQCAKQRRLMKQRAYNAAFYQRKRMVA